MRNIDDAIMVKLAPIDAVVAIPLFMYDLSRSIYCVSFESLYSQSYRMVAHVTC